MVTRGGGGVLMGRDWRDGEFGGVVQDQEEGVEGGTKNRAYRVKVVPR